MKDWIRQTHRWLSIAFTVAVIMNIVAMIMQVPAQWIGFLALVPLIPLMFTGLYMFFRPYLSKEKASA